MLLAKERWVERRNYMGKRSSIANLECLGYLLGGKWARLREGERRAFEEMEQ
jgi:hypothetical protein